MAALAYGLVWWLYRGERAVPAALAVAGALLAYAHFSGTPYQEAKSIVLASPLAMLVPARALLSGESAIRLSGLRGAVARRRGGLLGCWARHESLLRRGPGNRVLRPAAGCSLLALVNGPVGPATYSQGLAKLRPARHGSTLVLAPEHLLADEHGRDYLVWELRGGRVCVEAAGARSTAPPPPGISQVITQAPARAAPFAEAAPRAPGRPVRAVAAPARPRGHGSCPLISGRTAREPGARIESLPTW